MSENIAKSGLKITALSISDAARVLSSAYGRKITEDQVRSVAEAGGLLGPDGAVNLLEYAAFLSKEVTNANAD